MGMFDKLTPFTERFQEGQPFTLQAAKLGPTIDTEYGPSRVAMLQIDGEWFSIFGQGILGQIERMASGDLPAEVKVIRQETRNGQKVKLIVPANANQGDDIPF